jgi:NAD(P)-dependent dehydrogenase (short-subunit alcohol dehydrogenase family)
MGELSGRNALVTGGSRGIGAACARALVAQGARVAIASRSKEALDELAEELGPDTVVLESDLAQSGQGVELADRAIESLGVVDILVNNAGASFTVRTDRLTEEMVDDLIALNLRSAIMVSSVIGRQMRQRGMGSIINISSTSGQSASPGLTVYAATKGGLDAATRNMAADWGLSGVRVNAVAPGLIVTDMWTENRKIPGIIETLEGRVSLRRWGVAEEIGDVVAFLASDRARYITGQVINVDGGLTQHLEPVLRVIRS